MGRRFGKLRACVRDRLTWTQDKQRLKDNLERNNQPLPTWMQDRPEPEPHQQWLWAAFWQLSHSRQVGMGEGPIPVSEVEAYCRFYGIDDLEEREYLLSAVQALDAEYLSVREEQGPSSQ